MSLRKEHELHIRRRSRNVGVGLILGGFVVLIMALTVVKLTSKDFKWPNQVPTTAAPTEGAGS